MRFRVSHITDYKYRAPASDSFAELRVWPRSNDSQRVIQRSLVVEPETVIDHYVDYFGNYVEFFSIPFRHNAVRVHAEAEVETFPIVPRGPALDVAVGEARQIFNSRGYRHYDFLQPSSLVPLNQHGQIRRQFFRQADSLRDALEALNGWIFKNFTYESGSTDVFTPIREVVAQRKGVCQDFAHLMLALLRGNGFPARYVSGYIEASDPEKADSELVGAAASHAWVEVCLPGGLWWGLDPTNNQVAGERHIVVAVGRDYNDVAPMRGTYKGAKDQKLNVMVSLQRKPTNT